MLRLATNSFSTDEAYSMNLLGGPKVVRPLAFPIAAITRSAGKTIKNFSEQRESLVCEVVNTQWLDSIPSNFKSDPRPKGWDSPAYASNLLKAWTGELADSYFPGSMFYRGTVLGSSEGACKRPYIAS